jgi:hypothetical protein
MMGHEYTGERRRGAGGHNKLIIVGSVEEQILADAIESGCGFRQATRLVNEHRKQLDPPPGLLEVVVSAVYGAHLRLEPVVTAILDRKQGSFDKTSGWAKARLMFVLQLLIRFGLMTGVAAWCFLVGVPVGALFAAGVPAYFATENLGSLEPGQPSRASCSCRR